jgi:two-component system LytT family sensor kinase
MAFTKTYWILLLLTMLFFSSRISAQSATIDSFGHSFYFDLMTTDKRSMVREPVYVTISDTAIHGIFDKIKTDSGKRMTSTTPRSSIILGVKLNPSIRNFFSAAVESISKDYYTFLVSDSSEATVVGMGINPGNYRDFRYHVVENDSLELIPWSPITQLEQAYGAKQPYALLGRLAAPGKRIMIEVVSANNYSMREGVIIDWRTDQRPILEQIIVEVPGNYFNLAYPDLNHGYATRFNRVTGVPEDFRFYADSIRDVAFHFKKQETLVRSVHLIRKLKTGTDTLRLGMVDQHGVFVLSDNFQEPGLYQLVFQRQQRRPAWDEEQLLRIPFEVLSPDSTDIHRLILIAGITIGLLLLAMIFFYRVYRRRVKEIARQKETAQLKLKSIRSQLNPHFMFNALSSIQNLMNKQETEEANHYLTRFAVLTRSVLDSSEQDLISLKEELAIVDNYLQMEQLRFGFSYELSVEPGLQPANIDVPPMLLQPFVENAVKHGIAGRKSGRITVQVMKEGNKLKLLVNDDGIGFDTKKQYTGFGMKLSRERIELLNQFYPATTFGLDIHSSKEGTSIAITLNNWI